MPRKHVTSEYIKRVARIFRILTLAQAGPGLTVARLVDDLGVVERTIRRDIETIRDANIPLDNVRGEGYRIRADFQLPPVQLNVREALALTLLADQVAGSGQLPMLEPAVSAADKVRSTLPRALQDNADDFRKALSLRLARVQPADGIGQTFQTVSEATVKRLALRCEYEPAASTHPPQPFEFEPYQLTFIERAWYVIGRHCLRRQVRCLKLSRFTRCERTQRAFKVPASFSLEKHFGNAWRMIRGDERYTVKLRIKPEFADTVEDTRWHTSQEAWREADGSLRVDFSVDGLDEIVWWILGMGPFCTVLEPPQLAQRVLDLAQQTAALYPASEAAAAPAPPAQALPAQPPPGPTPAPARRLTRARAQT